MKNVMVFALFAVAAFGQTHRKLVRRSTVDLRRAAGSGPSTIGWTPILEIEEPVVHQPVQVELRHVHSDSDSLGSLLTAHGLRLRHYEAVEGMSQRFSQGSDAGHLDTEVVRGLRRSDVGEAISLQGRSF